MKKVLLGLAVVSSIVMAGDGANLYLKTGLDISGKFDEIEVASGQSLNKSESDRLGFDLTAEVTREFYPNLELGLGFSYQDHGRPEAGKIGGEKFQNTGYKSLPAYAVAKYNIPLESNIKPYLKTDLGYSFNFDEKDLKVENEKIKMSVDNGLYYGLGAGIEYNNFVVELMYKVNRAKVQHEYNSAKSSKFDYEYSRTTLSFGYRFDI
ncbi:OmpW family outer membrane protein [Fusobacterium necrogenes]|uniref:OmpW family outer membrane protein n=1 Tax=Fusobacterium necrogenes TaxID=858 RepID=UPI00255CB41F|nr:outer membrane beta-barrel protein [Fusobacterium necrogenes]